MKFSISLRNLFGAWPAMLIGLVAFVAITGGTIVRPTYVDWLMQQDDPATHWLGWQFFRHSPVLQLPLGANLKYGMDSFGSSIVFSDSIPLLALLFKPFSAILPDTFQYIGLWILICFLLQSFFAWKLLGFFTQDRLLQLIGSAFFVLAPVCLMRLIGHYALLGQWVLLASVYLYLSKPFSIFRWIGLLSVTALIHAYLLIMVGVLWVADIFQRYWRKEAKAKQALVYLIAGSFLTAIIMWLAGYFIVGKSVTAGGFGYYRMNLLSLVDPGWDWSRLVRNQNRGGGDYEGFNYLGLGILGLALIAFSELVRDPKIDFDFKTLVPLLLVSLGLWVYAISNHIAIGNYELFTYNLPRYTERFAHTFRASGRMFWPVYYLICLAIFYIVFTRLERRLAITLCAALLCAQIIDTSGALHIFRKKFSDPPKWSSPMRSPLWNDMAGQYQNIIFVLPHFNPNGWMALAHFAATNRMAINIGPSPRVNPWKEYNAREQVGTSILFNDLNPDSLYIFEDDGLWKVASNQIGPSDVAGVLEGFRIVAPKLKDCSKCDRSAIASISVEPRHVFDYRMGRLSFTTKGSGQQYAVQGWATPEKWGTWSVGDASAVLLELSAPPQSDLDLMIEGHAFVNEKHPTQEINVLVNKHVLDTLKYESASNVLRVVKIPKALASEPERRVVIQFKFKNPKSPAELGLSDDARRLGLGIVSLGVKPSE